MPRPLLDSPYIFGLHDPGGEWIMAQAGRRGWILFTEAVGSDPNDRSGADYRPYSEQDFGVIVRINNGYGAVGTIPTPEHYASFARRVANFVAASPGCHIWIIGNETNHPQEWPIDHRGPRPILPEDYVRCFRLCRDAIRSLPDHRDDLVVIAAVAPWNAQLTYPANPTGDWILYFRHILEGLGSDGLDGIALHTYTHGPDPALITDRSTMNPPFQHRFFNFQAYRNFMEAIPAPMRSLPVFITESNQDAPWLDANNGWVQAAYAEIDRWNRQPGAQQIRCLLLYRWQPYDQWRIEGKNGVIADFRAALANDYRWKEPPPKPARYQVGDVVRTLTAINLRAAPSGQIIGVLPPGTQATIRSAPHVMSGGLPFWAVRVLFNGQPHNGWLAQYTLDGLPLLMPETFGNLRPATYRADDKVRTLEVINLRSQPAGPVLGQLPRNTVLTVLDPVFVMATGIPWWSVRVSGTREGWVAQYTQGGVTLLEGVAPPTPERSAATSGSDVGAKNFSPPPANVAAPTFAPGVEVRTRTLVRMRRTPGVTNKPAGDTIALVPAGVTLALLEGPRRVDDIEWWRVRGTLPDVGRVEGWMARSLPSGEVLLELALPEPPAPPAIEPPQPPTPRYTFVPGDRLRTTTLVRLRRSPGYLGKGPEDIIADIAPAVEGVIVAGPAEKDGLIWWQVQITARDGSILAGWMAEATAEGEVLLQKIDAPAPLPGFRVGDLVQTADFLNVRRTPGIANKPPDDILGALRPRTTVVILDGPQQVGGLTWWRGGGIVTPPGVAVRGWMAEALQGPNSVPLLVRAPALPGTNIPDAAAGVYLHSPFDGVYTIGQLWGENSAFYARYSYDGVPLLGHNGVDFSTPVGVALRAVDDGVVLRVDFEAGGFGNYILLGHSWGESIYAHLSAVEVSVGQNVTRGQLIGRSGNTGASTGPHLHFAIRIHPYSRADGWGGFSDPLPYLPPTTYRLPPYILDRGGEKFFAPAFAMASAAPNEPFVRLAPSGMGAVPGRERP
jgi:hypothetical protein